MVKEVVEEVVDKVVMEVVELFKQGKVFCAVMHFFLFVINRTRYLVVVVDTRQVLLGGFSSSLQLKQADTKSG